MTTKYHYLRRKFYEFKYPLKSKKPKISYITTCKGRRHHLEHTLRQNIIDNESYTDNEFIVVNYSSNDGLESWLNTELKAEIKTGLVKLLNVPNRDFFEIAHAKNLGHRAAQGDILCNLDADNWTGKNFSNFLAEHFLNNPQSILSGHWKIRRGSTGRIALRRGHFLMLGGYDQQMQGWGFEDRDLIARAEAFQLKWLKINPGFLNLISHDDTERFQNYPLNLKTRNQDNINKAISQLNISKKKLVANSFF